MKNNFKKEMGSILKYQNSRFGDNLMLHIGENAYTNMFQSIKIKLLHALNYDFVDKINILNNEK